MTGIREQHDPVEPADARVCGVNLVWLPYDAARRSIHARRGPSALIIGFDRLHGVRCAGAQAPDVKDRRPGAHLSLDAR
jgi:hypothetical protein